MTWNFNMDEAPKGRMVTKTVKTAKGERTFEEFEPQPIIAATKCGLVVKSQWYPPRMTQTGHLLDGNRWSGFGVNDAPIAWQPWPVHPNNVSDGGLNIVTKHLEIA